MNKSLVSHSYLTSVVGLVALSVASNETVTLLISVFISLAAWIDFKERMLPNWLTYSFLAAALVCNSLASFLGTAQLPLIGIEQSLWGLLACSVLMLIPYLQGGVGAGDVKMAAGLGAMLGPRVGLSSIAIGYIVAAIILLLSGLWGLSSGRSNVVVERTCSLKLSPAIAYRQVSFPLGTCVSLGTVITLLRGAFL